MALTPCSTCRRPPSTSWRDGRRWSSSRDCLRLIRPCRPRRSRCILQLTAPPRA